jgi:hypothetical protein
LAGFLSNSDYPPQISITRVVRVRGDIEPAEAICIVHDSGKIAAASPDAVKPCGRRIMPRSRDTDHKVFAAAACR